MRARCLWGGDGAQPQRACFDTLGGESGAATHQVRLVYTCISHSPACRLLCVALALATRVKAGDALLAVSVGHRDMYGRALTSGSPRVSVPERG